MKKRIISTILCITLVFTMAGCGKNTSSQSADEEVPEEGTEVLSYNISACLTESNDYNEALYLGFKDALEDYLGSASLKISKYTGSDVSPTDSIAGSVVRNSPDLVFTAGKQMLTSMTAVTEDIPIVATGIVDFQGVLRIASTGSSSWDKTTGINVTGVSSKPSIVDQVSMMIESTDNLQAVGILFSPEDTEAIYQNEIFEKYLDQAGIPWKEYLIPATEAAIMEDEDQSSTALSPSKFVASSAKSGMDNEVVSLGEDVLIGLNSTTATRTALSSENWTGGKASAPIVPGEEVTGTVVEETATDSEEITDEIVSDTISPFENDDADEDEEEPAVPTLEERITEVCNECSAIYIPFGSMLADQMDTISQVCIKYDVTTVAGDTTIGQNALVTLFFDPYSLGYSAGKKAVKILQGSDVSTMTVGYGNSDESVKLYNGTIAEEMGMTFPKSFSEINEFLATYEYGSTTTRKTSSEDEEE